VQASIFPEFAAEAQPDQPYRVGVGLYQYIHRFCEILDAVKEAQFIKKTVVDRNVDTTFGGGIKEAIETKDFHYPRRLRTERGTPCSCSVTPVTPELLQAICGF
jgi:hypothetical protein